MANDFINKYVRKGSRKSKPMTTKSNSWITNALKSVGYSSFDVLTELMPSTMDFAKSTADIGTDIATSIQKARTSDRTLKSALNQNFYAGLGKDILKNSIEDLKSGKFYNKDRTAKLFDDMNDDLGDIDFDFGDDEDFDMDEFDDSIDSSDGMAHASIKRKKAGNNEVTNIVMGTDLGPDSALVKATEFQTETSVNVGQAVIDNSRVNNRAMMTMVGGLRNEVSTSLSSISDNIATMTEVVSETLGKHASLSAKYYEDSISLQTQILEHLKTHVTGGTTNTNTKQFKDYNNILDIITSGGALDLSAYKNLVKKQAGNYIDNNMVLSQLKFMNDNKEAMSMTAASPFQKILENTVKSIIPATMQKAMTAFDNQLKETTVAALNQVSGLQRSSNPFLSAIGQIFGVQNKITQSKIDKSEYNKGAMSWSGTDHQALTNVIPTLLRKIYASISGTQEVDFDYDKGVFRTVKDMEKTAEEDRRYKETSVFSDYKSDFRDFMEKNFANSREDKNELSKQFETFLTKLVKDSYGGRNWRLGGRTGDKKDENGILTDDIRDLLGASNSNDKNVKAIRSYMEYLAKVDPSALTRMFGGAVQEQRAVIDKYVKDMQLDPTKYNTKYIDTGLTGALSTDAHLVHGDVKDKSRVTGVKSGVAAGTIDKFGNNSNYYLREILSTLTTGIYVVPVGGLGGKSRRSKNNINSRDKELLSSIDERRTKINDKLSSEKRKNAEENRNNKTIKSNYDNKKQEKDLKDGKFDINNESFDTTVVASRAAADKQVDMSTEDQSFIGKVLGKIPEDSGLGRILGRIRNGRNKVGEKGTGLFKTLDKALFDVVFGSGDNRKGAAAIFNKAMGVLKSGFAQFGTFLDNKIFKPLDNALFGEDGFITKLKQSEFGQKISDTFKKLKEKTSSFFLGELGDDGKRSGGLFSETYNSLKDIGTQIKTAIVGEKGPDGKPLPLDQDNSIVGNLKRMAKSVTSNVGQALGIEKSEEPLGTRLNNTVNKAFNRIKERTKEWTDNIFGQEDEKGEKTSSILNSEFASQFKADMKGQKGYIGATSTIGLLSSFFLPGGPIGGALVGASVGIISKSNGLKDLLFGEKDEDGSRVGGIVTKEVQDFFKNNKTGMAVGAVGGLASSVGLLPSFFLPGGPIGGALIGTSVSLIAKSGAFNTLLYGEGGTKDDPTGGLMANIKKAFGKDKNLKNVGIDAGIGAGVGILGSFFLPGGPLIHALLGSALSIGTATDKFKNWFFGEEGADGKRSGGIFNKFTGYMKEKIFSPLATSVKLAQSHIMQFVEENMVLPFKFAIDPLVKEAKHAKDVVKEKISNVFDSFKTSLNKRVVKPIGDTIDKYLITPIKNTLSKLFSGLGKVVGSIISAPFKMVGAMGWSAYDKQKKRGKEDYINNAGREDKSFFGRVKGAFKRTGMRMGLVDREGVNAAQYSEKGASYEAGQEVERRQRYDDEKAAIRKKREEERAAIRNGTYTPTRTKKSKTKIDTKSKSKTDNYKPKKASKSKAKVEDTSTKIRTIEAPKNTPSKAQKKAYRNAYKEAENTGFTRDELREYVTSYKLGNENSSKTKVSLDKKSKTDNYKPKKASKSKAKVEDTSTKVDTTGYKPEKSKSSKRTKDTGTLLQSIQKDVSKISDSVYGQLNGVGSNVNKIYKLLLKRFGKKDEDIKGDNNKEYVGFFGKIRTALNNPLKALKGALMKPIDAAKNIITAPFRLIGKIGRNIASTFKSIGTGIAKAGKAVISGIGSLIKGLGTVTLELLKVPLDIIHTGLTAVRAALPALGEAVKLGVKVIGTGLEVAGNVLITSVKTVGNVIAESAKGIGKLIGGALSGLGSMLSAVGLIGKDVLKGVWGGMKFLGKGALKVGKAVVTAPFKAVGGIVDHFKNKGKGGLGRGKGPVHVIVDSGVLDKVKVVNLVKKVTGIKDEYKSPSTTDTIVNTKPVLPMNLQTFGGKKSEDSDNSNVKSIVEEGKTKVSSIIDGTKDKLNGVADKAKNKFSEAKETLRSKLKRKDDAERAEQVKKGSRESLLGRLNAADKEKDESKFKTKLLSIMGRNADASEEHKSSFMKVFDIKKGLITAGILMLAPFIIKLFKKFDIGSLLSSIAEGIGTGFKEIGGFLGLFNNVEEKADQAKAVVTGDENNYKIDDDGNLVYDENGNLVKETEHVGHLSALLTPTKTRINTETGKWENNQTWTSTSDSIVNYAGHKAIGIGKTGVKVYDKGKKVVTGVKNAGKKVFDYATSKSDKLTSAYVKVDDAIKGVKSKIGGKATEIATNVKGKAGEKATKVASAVKDKASTIANKVGGKAKDVAEKVITKSKDKGGILDKAITMMGKAIDLLVSKFKDLGTKYGVKITESALGKVIKQVRGILKPEKLKGYADKIGEFITKITGKSSVAAGTLFLADIGFAIYGVLDGACNAGAMFEVNPDDVDAKMRAIAAVFKGLLNTSIGSWVDLVSSLVYEILGYNFLKSIATYVYKLISDDDGDKKLDEAQKQFTEDYEKTVEQEYAAYVEDTKAQGKEPMSLEEFKASDLSTTRSEYNSKVNKSLGKRFVDTVKGVGSKIANSKVGKAVGGAVTKVGKGIKGVGSKIANSKVGKAVGGALATVGGGIATGVKTVGKGVKGVGKGIGKAVGGAAAAIGGLFSGKSKKKNSESDDTKTSKSKSTKTVSASSDSKVQTTSENDDVIHVIVDGGTLDVIKSIGTASKITEVKSGKSSNGKLANSLGISKGINNTNNKEGINNFISGALGINGIKTLGKKAVSALKGKVSKSNKSTTKIKSLVKKLNKFIDPKKSIGGWDKLSISSTNDDDDNVESISNIIIKKLMWLYVGTARNVKTALNSLNTSSSSSSGSVISSALSTAGNVVKSGVSTAASTSKSVGSTLLSGAKSIGSAIGSIWDKVTGKGGIDGGRPIGGKGGDTTVNGSPYYSQNDPKYKNEPYKGNNGGYGELNSTMGESGCGPTAMAMVASKVTGNKYDPVTMAKLAQSGGYTSSIGTSPAYFSDTANALGIPNEQSAPSANNLAGSLANGNSVILQGVRNGRNNSPYTSEGHYVTATGIDKDGNVLVNDPRGKEYSGAYKMSDVMKDTTGMWSFGGGHGSPKKKFFKRKGIIGGFGTGDTSNWLNIVKSVKQAIAAQSPGYSQSKFIKITVGGKTLSVRTDCSGYVSACLKYYGVLSDNINLDSRSITSQSGGMKNTGFTYMTWPGWDSLQEGDILARDGHTEIFAYNQGGTHYVYNCGSDKSVNSATPTATGHKNGYTTVWRCGAAGSGAITGTSVDGSSSSSSSGVSSFSELLGGMADAFTNPILEALGLKTTDTSTDSSGDSEIVDANLTGSDNAQKIWNFFKQQGLTNQGIAGLMGNIQQESSLNPKDLQGSYEKKLGYTDDTYTTAVDNGSYTNFVNDSAGYGLAQWTYHSLKQELLDYKKQTGKSIGDLGMQLSFLAKQLQESYPSVWSTLKTTNSIKDATDKVMLEFERPKDQSQSARNKRAGYSQSFYNSYAGGSGGTDGGRPIKSAEQSLGGGKGQTKQKVSVSSTSMQDSTSTKLDKIISESKTSKTVSDSGMTQLINTVIDYLSKIVDNTGATSSELETLNNKDFGTTQTTNNVVSNTNNSYNDKSKTSKSDKTADRSDYNMAKRVAAGILT